MSFINAPIALEQLPRFESLTLQPVQRSYLKILRQEWAISAFILAAIAAGLFFLIPALRQSYAWIFLLIPWLLMIGLHRLLLEKKFPYLAYAVREKDVISQHGWITRSVRICPNKRIQNCSVQSGPLERRAGLASLTIYTAGSDNADIRIPGLLQEEAEQLRHFILQNIHAEAHEGA